MCEVEPYFFAAQASFVLVLGRFILVFYCMITHVVLCFTRVASYCVVLYSCCVVLAHVVSCCFVLYSCCVVLARVVTRVVF